MSSALALQLCWRPFELLLPQPLQTAQGVVAARRGWLLRLSTADGRVGWGEAAPLTGALTPLASAIEVLGRAHDRAALEDRLPSLPPVLAFALGAALAELDGLPLLGWLSAPASAELLPAGEAALEVLERWLAISPAITSPTFKWKVAVEDDARERAVLEQLLLRLPKAAWLRLDANGGWDRCTALAWAKRLEAEPRLQWLEQPLAPDDGAGLRELTRRYPGIPIALDEALALQPALRQSWSGWQVRRPSQDGDPRPLLEALERGVPRLMLSTGFETGIGRRWLEHLAALQARGPTPVAPGLAPGWQPTGDLGADDPQRVWHAAGAEL